MWSATLVNASRTLRVPHYFGGSHSESKHIVPHVSLAALHYGSPSHSSTAGHTVWDITASEESRDVVLQLQMREVMSQLNEQLETEHVIGENAVLMPCKFWWDNDSIRYLLQEDSAACCIYRRVQVAVQAAMVARGLDPDCVSLWARDAGQVHISSFYESPVVPFQEFLARERLAELRQKEDRSYGDSYETPTDDTTCELPDSDGAFFDWELLDEAFHQSDESYSSVDC